MSRNPPGLIRVHRTQQLPTSPRARGRMRPAGPEPCRGGCQPAWGTQAGHGRLQEPSQEQGKALHFPAFLVCRPPSHGASAERWGRAALGWQRGTSLSTRPSPFARTRGPTGSPAHTPPAQRTLTHPWTHMRGEMCTPRCTPPLCTSPFTCRCQQVPKRACKACVGTLTSSETAPLLPMLRPWAQQLHPPPKPLFLTLLSLPPPGSQLPGAARSLL